jgi:hypothetical protein
MSRARKQRKAARRGTKVSGNTAQYPAQPEVGVQMRHAAPIGPVEGALRVKQIDGPIRIDDDPVLVQMRQARRLDLLGRAAAAGVGVLIVGICVGTVVALQEWGVL